MSSYMRTMFHLSTSGPRSTLGSATTNQFLSHTTRAGWGGYLQLAHEMFSMSIALTGADQDIDWGLININKCRHLKFTRFIFFIGHCPHTFSLYGNCMCLTSKWGSIKILARSWCSFCRAWPRFTKSLRTLDSNIWNVYLWGSRFDLDYGAMRENYWALEGRLSNWLIRHNWSTLAFKIQVQYEMTTYALCILSIEHSKLNWKKGSLDVMCVRQHINSQWRICPVLIKSPIWATFFMLSNIICCHYRTHVKFGEDEEWLGEAWAVLVFEGRLRCSCGRGC